MEKILMRELLKRTSLVFLLSLGGMILSLAWVGNAETQEKKPPEVKMPGKPLPDDALITMDFQDVDLSTVIKFMGELTGKNFLVGDQVRGKVTIISPKKITVQEAYKVFESVLEMNGYTAVPTADAIKIIPSGIARQTGLEIHEGKEADLVRIDEKMITQVVPLEYASSEELRNLFTPLISKDGSVIAYRPTNHLVITERASNIHRLLKIIEQIDIRIIEEKISVFPLEFASARTLADKLTQLVSSQQAQPVVPGRPPTPSTFQRIVKVIPDERTNSLIVLANEEDTKEVRQLISRLDREAPKGKSQLHVRYLQHARAEDLAKVLGTIITARTRALQRLQAPQQPGAVEETTITADKATNSLVVTASPQDMKDLEEIIQKLDGIRSQVLVEALIAEVSMKRALQIGVEWRIMDQPTPDSTRGIGGTDFGLIKGVQTGTLQDPGLVLGVVQGFITVGGVQVPNIGALVRAFQSDTEANVLSTPHLLTMDNEKAKIIVADNVPIIKQDVSTPLVTTGATTASVAISRTFDYKDIGIQLEITPHISTASMVRLEISTEVSNITSIDPTNPGFVTMRKRQATTTVSVESGQIVVIGGLIRDDRTEIVKKVPCIANIPVLGWLFKTFSGERDKTNLLIFITPYIIRTPEDLDRATAKKKQDADENLKKLQKERGNEVKDTFDMLTR
jgi:general secretion pathway protein D